MTHGTTTSYRKGCRCAPCKAAGRGAAKASYATRKWRVFAIIGERCAHCGTTGNLEVDHIDPATKAFNVLENVSRRLEDLVPELRKCQPLCARCHKRKTALDYDGGAFSYDPRRARSRS